MNLANLATVGFGINQISQLISNLYPNISNRLTALQQTGASIDGVVSRLSKMSQNELRKIDKEMEAQNPHISGRRAAREYGKKETLIGASLLAAGLGAGYALLDNLAITPQITPTPVVHPSAILPALAQKQAQRALPQSTIVQQAMGLPGPGNQIGALPMPPGGVTPPKPMTSPYQGSGAPIAPQYPLPQQKPAALPPPKPPTTLQRLGVTDLVKNLVVKGMDLDEISTAIKNHINHARTPKDLRIIYKVAGPGKINKEIEDYVRSITPEITQPAPAPTPEDTNFLRMGVQPGELPPKGQKAAPFPEAPAEIPPSVPEAAAPAPAPVPAPTPPPPPPVEKTKGPSHSGIIKQAGVEGLVKSLAKANVPTIDIAHAIINNSKKETRAMLKSVGHLIPKAIEDYLEELKNPPPPETKAEEIAPTKEIAKEAIPEPVVEKTPKGESVAEKVKKLKPGSLATLPDGKIGNIERIKNGIAKLKVGDKERHVKADEIEPPPLPEKDLATLYQELIDKTEKEIGEEVSKHVEWAGYEEDSNTLAYKPHGREVYTFEDIDPEDAKELLDMAVRATSGESIIGPWKIGTKSPIGSRMSALIKKYQERDEEKEKQYERKYKTIYAAHGPAQEALKKKKDEEKRTEQKNRQRQKKPRG